MRSRFNLTYEIRQRSTKYNASIFFFFLNEFHVIVLSNDWFIQLKSNYNYIIKFDKITILFNYTTFILHKKIYYEREIIFIN